MIIMIQKRDSLTYTINNIDYGFQVIVDKVKVNIAVFLKKMIMVLLNIVLIVIIE